MAVAPVALEEVAAGRGAGSGDLQLVADAEFLGIKAGIGVFEAL